ncbi:MAG: methyltransferase domain-containing protein [Spirochaetales bacterium]|nr:methyltransferase domain-containing protein [Spirochaetales bacterium]
MKKETGKKEKKKITQVLGPVSSLESYVKADWWREIFNANYLRTDGDVVSDMEITKKEIDKFLSILNCDNNAYILDLCCGQGRHCFELSDRGFKNVYGIDRSHYLITKGRTQTRREARTVNFKEGDARRLPYPTDFFDVILILGNSFGYFESQNDDLAVLNQAFRVLKPGGTLLIDVTEGDHVRKTFEPRSWEWIDKDYFVCRERCLSQDEDRLVSREVITHVKKGVIADQFYAERLYSQETLFRLFTESGFTNTMVHSKIITESQRNQDLGMMAQRIIITGTAEKEWTRIPKQQEQKHVAVLMGDPNVSDIIKPNNTFDTDDFHTINELKKALSSLKEYRFSYLNNHKTLINDLQKNKGTIDFILNLCDEGYNNEAIKELHVPALIEMLEIPYTGGNPQCLAFCYDKSLVRGIAIELDIPVPQAFIVKPDDITFIEFPLQFPVIVKPNLGDSSFGITKDNVCNNFRELEEIITAVRQKVGYDSNILVEDFLTGKDLSVGIIGNMPDAYTILPIIEEDYSDLPEDLPRICGYEAKWDPQSPYWKNLKSIPAELPEETERFLVASCLKLFSRLDCRDYARFDWRIDKHGTPRLLEVNPNPGWCWDGHLAKMSRISGVSYPEMLGLILKSCEKRLAEQKIQDQMPE